MKQYTLAEARDQLTGIVHEVAGGAPVQLIENGQTVAVVLSPAAFEQLSHRGAGTRNGTHDDLYEAGPRDVAESGTEIAGEAFEGLRDPSPTGGRQLTSDHPSLWEGIEAWRSSVDLDSLNFGDADFVGLRERGPGRAVDLP